jgi:hypothetical protein
VTRGTPGPITCCAAYQSTGTVTAYSPQRFKRVACRAESLEGDRRVVELVIITSRYRGPYILYVLYSLLIWKVSRKLKNIVECCITKRITYNYFTNGLLILVVIRLIVSYVQHSPSLKSCRSECASSSIKDKSELISERFKLYPSKILC